MAEQLNFDDLMSMKAPVEAPQEEQMAAVIGEDNPHKAFLFNGGELELLQHMGDELNIVNAARQSFGQSRRANAVARSISY